jgi:4-hydroxy-tetrahydrodipicolinate synthase
MAGRKGSEFAGVGVAIVTPFRDDKLDVETLKKQIEFQIASGTNFLVPVGTTGESPTLSHDEHERVISEVIQLSAGRCKVMAGTGSNCTDEALRLTRRAQKEGADASLQVAPYYNKPTQKGFYEHFKAIAEATGDLPVILYNVPGRSVADMSVDTALRLAAFFGTDAQSWVNLQTHYDTELAREAMADTISKIHRFEASHT